MRRVSVRTLVLMTLLLGFVLAHQNMAPATPGPCAVWLLDKDVCVLAPIPADAGQAATESWTSCPNEPQLELVQ